MRIRHLAALVAMGITLTLAAPAPSANADHSWGGYHWARTSNPFTLSLGDNVDSRWDSYLATTSTDWSKSTVLDTKVVPGSVRPRTCKAKSGMVQVCNSSYGNTGWLGIAGISITGGTHITAGYVKLNDTYFDTASYNTPAWRNLVTCQEVGHTFGLDHQDEVFDNPNLGTCMDYTNDPSTNQHPNAHDYDMLATIYAHLDSTSTVGTTTAAGTAHTAGDTPATWGTRVAGSRASGQSTFVRSYGDGDYLVTHVFWAR